MFDLVGIGDPIIDTHVQIADDCAMCRATADHSAHLCFEYGGKIPIIDSFQALGGNAPNVAVGAVKLGLTSALVSTVGNDPYGELARQELLKQKVSADYITDDSKHKTRYSIVLNYKAERTILSYSDEKKYQWPKPFPQTSWIYYGGLSKGFEAMQEALFAHLKKHATVRLAVNPGSYMLKFALEELRAAVARADLLLVNLEEAEKITGRSVAKEKSVKALVLHLLNRGAKEVVVTDGPRGAYAGTLEEVWNIAAYPVPVVAKTGAGDAFSSGYLAARFYGHDIPKALQWGSANSAGVIQTHGPQAGLQTKTGVEKIIKKFPKVLPKKLI